MPSVASLLPKPYNQQKLIMLARNQHQNHHHIINELQTHCSATIIIDKNTTLTINVKEFAKISPYFHAAFYGAFLESKTKELMIFDKAKGKQFLKCCKLLEQIMKEDEYDVVSDLNWMSLEQAIEILDLASYMLIEPILALVSDSIVSNVTTDSLVSTYHKAEYRHVPLAQRLWKLIVQYFDRLVRNRTYLMLSIDEMMKLLCDECLNINKADEMFAVKEWISAHTDNGDGRVTQQCNESILQLDSMNIVARLPHLPNSILFASGGFCGRICVTNETETYNFRVNEWIQLPTLNTRCSALRLTRIILMILSNNGLFEHSKLSAPAILLIVRKCFKQLDKFPDRIR